MDGYDTSQPFYDTTYSFGPWLPWQTIARLGHYLLQQRFRWVTTTHTRTTITWKLTCRNLDPRNPYDSHMWETTRTYWDSDRHTTTSIWPIIQFRAIFDFHPITHDDYPLENALALPTLHPRDRFFFDTRPATHDDKAPAIRLDGTELRGQGSLKGAELGVGYHFLDFTGEIEGEPYRVHAAFNVIQPIEARFVDPLKDLDVDLSRAPIGESFALEVDNHSDKEITVRVRAHSVPEGWQVLFSERESLTLPPHSTRQVELVAELMNDMGLRDQLVPLTVEVIDAGRRGRADRVFATCYLRLLPVEPLDKRIQSNQALRLNREPRTYAAPKSSSASSQT